MYLTSQEHLLRLQTSIFNSLVDISTWMLHGHPEINKPKPELHPFFHVPLLSRAPTSVKETDTHCQILGGHNTPRPFAPTSVSHSLLNMPRSVTSLHHSRPSSSPQQTTACYLGPCAAFPCAPFPSDLQQTCHKPGSKLPWNLPDPCFPSSGDTSTSGFL